MLKGQVTTSYPARAASKVPVGFQSAVPASGSKVLQAFAALLIVIHMARPFDVVLTGFHIPLVMCGLAAIAAFTCGGFSGVKSPVGRMLTAFVVWSLLVSPFSVYRRGSAVYEWGYCALYFVLVLVVAGAPSPLKQLTNLISILAIGTTLSIIWFSRGGAPDGGSRVSGVGEWGNAGDFALTAGFLLPFCVFTAMLINNKGVKYIVLTAWTLFILRTTVATATRSAMIGFACVAIVLLLRVSMMKRVGIVIAGVVAAAVVVATIPGEALNRLSTMSAAIGLTDASPAETGEAMGSAAERKELQMDALKAIGDNFLVGVGPGQFPNYRYTHFLDAAGRHKRWFPAHNTYLQVAAECGFLGGLLYIFFLAGIFLTIYKIRRLNRPGSHPQWLLVNRIALCLELSLVFFAVCAAFLNCQTYAHQFIVAGMAIALERLTKAAIAQASQTPVADPKTFGAPPVFRSGGRPGIRARKSVALPSSRAFNN